LSGNVNGRKHLGDRDADGKMILYEFKLIGCELALARTG
jgi:hypothetical protein